jgi:hypothetical protein
VSNPQTADAALVARAIDEEAGARQR